MNKVAPPKQITQTQVIERIQQLIDTNDGDVGRLYHILECLKHNKPLYHSDQSYLENKLSTPFVIVEDEKPQENKILSKIQLLINSGIGDPGRLQYIYEMVSQNKPLYHSDQVYLENKLEFGNASTKNNTSKFEESHENSKNFLPPKINTNNLEVPKQTPIQSIPKLRGLMPKEWHPPENKSAKLTGIYDKIKTEEELLRDNKKIQDELEIQRSKLSQLILNRKEYEKQVLLEKSLLDSQINEEHLNIQAQTQLSEQILLQKKEIENVKSERNELMKKISIEKEKTAKELQYQRNQLSQTRSEQEEIEKQIKEEKTLLSKMLEEQKLNLQKQSQISLEIKEKQTDLEKTKKEFDEIFSQVTDEKKKLAESEKLKKLIKSQENDLNKTKEKRLKIEEVIAKEKEEIAKKTKEEQEKLKIQSILAKQITDEKNTLKEIQQKRKEIEKQIKSQKQELKEQQQKIKKELLAKNKQLKSTISKSKNSKSKKSSETI
ncbi:MAG: chromosome segregation protein SMC [Nitrosarchaeum sp.]